MDALEMPRIPVGDWVEAIVAFLRNNLGWLFDALRTLMVAAIDNLESLLALPPPLIFALLAGLLGWRLRSAAFGVFSVLAFLLVDGMNLWSQMIDTLSLIIIATVVAVAIGIPVGIAAARNDLVSTIARPVLDFMQTLPAFVYLIPAITFFAIGKVPGLVATLVFSIPPGVRFTELGIRQVDKEVIEAAHAFGASPNQTLTRVQIPLATPTIMGGVNQVIMLALSMVVIAGMVGAGGLGGAVFRSITRLNIGLGFESGISVVILAIFLDRITATLGTRSEAP